VTTTSCSPFACVSRTGIGALLVFTLCAACGDDSVAQVDSGSPMLRCVDPLPLDCEPTFPPTFDELYTRKIATTCGAASTGASCHAEAGAQGGLALADADGAYAALLGELDGRARVVPERPECSPLMQRLDSDDLDFVMPVGSPLSEGERCAFRQWIANGAER
jgi:hypothetical protein